MAKFGCACGGGGGGGCNVILNADDLDLEVDLSEVIDKLCDIADNTGVCQCDMQPQLDKLCEILEALENLDVDVDVSELLAKLCAISDEQVPDVIEKLCDIVDAINNLELTVGDVNVTVELDDLLAKICTLVDDQAPQIIEKLCDILDAINAIDVTVDVAEVIEKLCDILDAINEQTVDVDLSEVVAKLCDVEDAINALDLTVTVEPTDLTLVVAVLEDILDKLCNPLEVVVTNPIDINGPVDVNITNEPIEVTFDPIEFPELPDKIEVVEGPPPIWECRCYVRDGLNLGKIKVLSTWNCETGAYEVAGCFTVGSDGSYQACSTPEGAEISYCIETDCECEAAPPPCDYEIFCDPATNAYSLVKICDGAVEVLGWPETVTSENPCPAVVESGWVFNETDGRNEVGLSGPAPLPTDCSPNVYNDIEQIISIADPGFTGMATVCVEITQDITGNGHQGSLFCMENAGLVQQINNDFPAAIGTDCATVGSDGTVDTFGETRTLIFQVPIADLVAGIRVHTEALGAGPDNAGWSECFTGVTFEIKELADDAGVTQCPATLTDTQEAELVPCDPQIGVVQLVDVCADGQPALLVAAVVDGIVEVRGFVDLAGNEIFPGTVTYGACPALGESCTAPMFVEVCEPVEVVLPAGEACDNPLYVEVCNPPAPIDLSTLEDLLAQALAELQAINANTANLEALLGDLIAAVQAGDVILGDILAALEDILVQVTAINENTDELEALLQAIIDALANELTKLCELVDFFANLETTCIIQDGIEVGTAVNYALPPEAPTEQSYGIGEVVVGDNGIKFDTPETMSAELTAVHQAIIDCINSGGTADIAITDQDGAVVTMLLDGVVGDGNPQYVYTGDTTNAGPTGGKIREFSVVCSAAGESTTITALAVHDACAMDKLCTLADIFEEFTFDENGNLCVSTVEKDERCQWVTQCDEEGTEWFTCVADDGTIETVLGTQPAGEIICTSVTRFCGSYISAYDDCAGVTQVTVNGIVTPTPQPGYSTWTDAERAQWLRDTIEASAPWVTTTETSVCWTSPDVNPGILVQGDPLCRRLVPLSASIQQVCTQDPAVEPVGELGPCEAVPVHSIVAVEGCAGGVVLNQLLIFEGDVQTGTLYEQADGTISDVMPEGWVQGACPADNLDGQMLDKLCQLVDGQSETNELLMKLVECLCECPTDCPPALAPAITEDGTVPQDFPVLTDGNFDDSQWTVQLALDDLEACCPGIADTDSVRLRTTFVGHQVTDPLTHNGFVFSTTNGTVTGVSATNTWAPTPSGTATQSVGNTSTTSDAAPVDRWVEHDHSVADLLAGTLFATGFVGAANAGAVENIEAIQVEIVGIGSCDGLAPAAVQAGEQTTRFTQAVDAMTEEQAVATGAAESKAAVRLAAVARDAKLATFIKGGTKTETKTAERTV